MRSGQASRLPDSHGEAAMLLVESLLHGLIERSVITVADAVALVERASEIGAEISHMRGDSTEHATQSVGILAAISSSLRIDLSDEAV